MIDETRPGITDSITISVVRSTFPVLGGVDGMTESVVGGVPTVEVKRLGLPAFTLSVPVWLFIHRSAQRRGIEERVTALERHNRVQDPCLCQARITHVYP